jgi:hypothetical protein
VPDVVAARPADTEPDAERVQATLIRATPVKLRLSRAFRLSATIVGLARRALARADPQASRRELDVRFVELHYGRHIAEDLRADLERRDREQHPGA